MVVAPTLTSQLLNSIRSSGSSSRSLIVHGPQGIGKSTAVREAVRELLGLKSQVTLNSQAGRSSQARPSSQAESISHPNCLWINAKGTPIAAANVRGIADFIYNTSYLADTPKLAVIDGVNNLNIQSLNALLKPLEDLPKQTYFILIADNIRTLPATVLSRCSIVRAAPLSDDTIKAELAGNCPSLSMAEVAEYRYVTSSPETIKTMDAVKALDTYKTMLQLLTTEQHPSAKLYEFIEKNVGSSKSSDTPGKSLSVLNQLAIFRILITHLLSKAIKFKAGTLQADDVVIKAELPLLQAIAKSPASLNELSDLLDQTVVMLDKAKAVGLDSKAVALVVLSRLLA